MKRAILLLCFLLPLSAGAQDFGVGASAGISKVGYRSQDNAGSTLYLDISVTPDWHWAKHWGALADVTAGTAVAGTGAAHGHNTLQAKLLLAPYYEQRFDKWYFDIMAGAFIRARLPYLGPTAVRLGPTVGVGPAAGLRAGLVLSDRLDLLGSIRFERTLYDPLASTASAYLTDYRAGNIVAAVGVRFSLNQ